MSLLCPVLSLPPKYYFCNSMGIIPKDTHRINTYVQKKKKNQYFELASKRKYMV